MMPLLQQVKEIWDPNFIFNPGKIVQAKNIDEDLRISSFQVSRLAMDTQFQWRKEGGFPEAMNLCNGAGVCTKRAESGGTMCPSYMATQNEKDSTRGRANLFRQLFASKNIDAFNSGELKDALDLCLSCKACKSECPANVDMARMKAEFMQGWHNKNGISLSERFFGSAASIYPLASKLPKLSNWLMQSPGGKELLFQFFNIHKERTLPRFASQTFRKWFNGEHSWQKHWVHRGTNKSGAGKQKAALLIDPFVNYHEPEIGKAAVQVLEALGCDVIIPDVSETGRPQLSKGMVKQAKKVAHKNIPELYSLAKDDIPIVGLEPSEILTLRDEYLDLCEDSMLPQAEKIAENSFAFEEFFNRQISNQPEKKNLFEAPKQTVWLHGHCHTKALVGNEPALTALAATGYQTEEMKTGCCGMAGSFGYEANHYEVSMDIGELVLFPAVKEMDEKALVCAPGFSCRHQIADGTGWKAWHPAQLLAQAVK
jgi:Fe-S oxidoreductase